MKIFNRHFVSPIRFRKDSTTFSGQPNLTIRWDKSTMLCYSGGDKMSITTYILQIFIKTKEFKWAFVWRPGVTKHWWKRSKKQVQ